jgi:hypothetical protein
MVRNQKIVMLSSAVVAGAVVLAMAAEAVLRAPANAPASPEVYTLPASWVVRGGGEETAVSRATGLGRPDTAERRDRGPRGEVGPARLAGQKASDGQRPRPAGRLRVR